MKDDIVAGQFAKVDGCHVRKIACGGVHVNRLLKMALPVACKIRAAFLPRYQAGKTHDLIAIRHAAFILTSSCGRSRHDPSPDKRVALPTSVERRGISIEAHGRSPRPFTFD
jgi:hypothetical protein